MDGWDPHTSQLNPFNIPKETTILQPRDSEVRRRVGILFFLGFASRCRIAALHGVLRVEVLRGWPHFVASSIYARTGQSIPLSGSLAIVSSSKPDTTCYRETAGYHARHVRLN